jgi:hypothetical protein
MKYCITIFVVSFFAINFSFGQEKYTDNLITKNVILAIKLKIDSLEKFHLKNKNESTLKEIENQKFFLTCLDDEFVYNGENRFSDLSTEKIDKQIALLKIKKDSLKESIHKINSQTKKYNFNITELKTKIKETDDYEEIRKIENQILIYKENIFELNCTSRLIEIDLMITSRDLSYLWNLNKRKL